jgi:opacity protein-like surface antigen
MKKALMSLAVLCGFMFLFSSAASAQAVDVFGGYSYLHFNDQGESTNFNGGTGSVAFRVIPMVAVVGDFAGYHTNSNGLNGSIDTYMFGPKVGVPVGHLHPFAQVLFGGAHFSANANNGDGGTVSDSENSFAMALGGGVDYDLIPHIGVRLIQAEYVRTDLNDGATNRQNDARIAVGVTFHF